MVLLRGCVPGVDGLFSFRQHAAEDLARGGLGNRVRDFDPTDPLVRRDLAHYIVPQCLWRDRFPEYHEPGSG
jgi:hypothetical protein